jgi:hypothetical protein
VACVSLSSFLFPQSLTRGPHLSAPLLLHSSLPILLLRPIARRLNHHRARPPPSSSPPARASQLMQLITAFNPQQFPITFIPFMPGRSASSHPPLPPSLFKAELELPLSPFAPASHLHTHPSIAYTQCRRSVFAVPHLISVCSPPCLARASPEPCDQWRTVRIAYPFMS